ncbi:mitogen-activated protein kinase kinase kinase 14-like isoform X1 [Anguilla rostrata]|uniref:mitogen-activated protein kinase kinase kinase 14-like isoform X1 n=1 Tax=Anguilla rostrata TaxID=7938 RepID=UPI0030CEF0C0
MMGTRNRILNSTTPWTTVQLKGQLKGQLEGQLEGQSSLQGQRGDKEKSGGEDDPACREIPPELRKVLTQGTAEAMASRPLGTEKLCPFIAQAECDEQQEFSPSCSQRPYIGSPNCLIRRASTENNVAWGVACKEPKRPSSSRRKRQRQRKQREREGEGERGRETALSGVPEQESSGSPWLFHAQDEAPEFTSGCSRYSSTQSQGVQETERPSWQRTESPLTCDPRPRVSPGFAAVPKMSLYDQECASERHQSNQDHWRLARFGLRAIVCQEDPLFVPSFFKEVEKEARQEEEEGEDGRPGHSDTNEGLLFHPEEKLQPNDYEYREGRDYSVLQHIQNGSYGDVYSVQDNRTGFKCAAKKIPLKLFRSEEVGSWSALDSPRVLELYGAVREGPWVTLFMALKSGSVGQLIRERGRLPEDLALHYHALVLQALEHLHRKGVLHLDVKADNVLLSEDGKETYLTDFGHSERLDRNGWSNKANSGEGFPGTETHMAPEVVKGEPRSAKADVWSSCCMLLHMMTGCHPWTRYYQSPLCLKIAHEDPPLREIPSSCNSCTADVLKAGLQKDPIRRASATELKEKTTTALMAVGGLTSPVKGAYQEPAKAEPMETRHKCSGPLPSLPAPPSPTSPRKRNFELGRQCRSSWRGHSKNKDETEESSDADWLSSSPRPRPLLHPHSSRQPKGEWPDVSVLAWELEKEFYLSSLSQPHSLELQEQLLSCLSSGCHRQRDALDKDSGHWSVCHSGELSSGVYSGGSLLDGHSFGVDWRGSANPSPPCSFEGVDVWIQDFTGQCLQIRESPGVTVGYIATGISDQISERAFCLETRDGRPVCPEEEVLDSGLWLRCTPTPDAGRAWRWRVREGVLETRA